MHAGMFYDKFGPKLSILIGGVQGVFGFTMMWASVFFSLSVPVAALMVFSLFQGHSQAWCDVATIPLLADSFPNHKGTAIGFSKGFVGLAGALFSQLYAGFFKPDVLMFVIMCAVIFMVFSSAGVLIMNRQLPGFSAHENPAQVEANFRVAYTALYFLAAVLLLEALVGQFCTVGRGWEIAMSLVVLAIFWSLQFFIATRKEGQPDVDGCDGDDAITTALLTNAQKEVSLVEATEEAGVEAEDGGEGAAVILGTDDDMSLLEAFKTLAFWLLFFVLAIGCGSGLVLINNIGQVCKAQGRKPGSEDTFVSLISVTSCTGRILLGNASDWGV